MASLGLKIQVKKDVIIKLHNYVDIKLRISFGSKIVTGILKSFDKHNNLIL